MVRRDRHVLLALALLSLGLALAQSLVGFEADLLLAVPPLLMLAPLLLGRYVGEETIARLRRTAQAPRRAHRPQAIRLPRRDIVLPRGGRLVAAAMALRGPPSALLARAA